MSKPGTAYIRLTLSLTVKGDEDKVTTVTKTIDYIVVYTRIDAKCASNALCWRDN